MNGKYGGLMGVLNVSQTSVASIINKKGKPFQMQKGLPFYTQYKKTTKYVTPAKAGVQAFLKQLDSGLHRNDEKIWTAFYFLFMRKKSGRSI